VRTTENMPVIAWGGGGPRGGSPAVGIAVGRGHRRAKLDLRRSVPRPRARRPVFARWGPFGLDGHGRSGPRRCRLAQATTGDGGNGRALAGYCTRADSVRSCVWPRIAGDVGACRAIRPCRCWRRRGGWRQRMRSGSPGEPVQYLLSPALPRNRAIVSRMKRRLAASPNDSPSAILRARANSGSNSFLSSTFDRNSITSLSAMARRQ